MAGTKRSPIMRCQAALAKTPIQQTAPKTRMKLRDIWSPAPAVSAAIPPPWGFSPSADHSRKSYPFKAQLSYAFLARNGKRRTPVESGVVRADWLRSLARGRAGAHAREPIEDQVETERELDVVVAWAEIARVTDRQR